MATLWGLESLAQNGAEAAEITGSGDTCAADDQPVTHTILRLGGYGLQWLSCFRLRPFFAVVAYIAWKASADLFHCWNQVGDEDAYIAEQAHTIDMLDGRFYELGERVTETSNEVSMIHDYVSGVHYALVEGGDFLRKGLGLTNEQWIHLNTLGTRQHSCTSHYGDAKVHASGETACGCNWNSRFN